jgi:hypothetical protein
LLHHIRQHLLCFFGKYSRIVLQKSIKVLRKISKGNSVVVLEIFGQKMIIKYIDYHARIMVILGVQAFGADSKNGMRIGKGINGTVQQNAFLNFDGMLQIVFATHGIGHEIAGLYPRIGTRKMNVCEKIQEVCT